MLRTPVQAAYAVEVLLHASMHCCGGVGAVFQHHRCLISGLTTLSNLLSTRPYRLLVLVDPVPELWLSSGSLHDTGMSNAAGHLEAQLAGVRGRRLPSGRLPARPLAGAQLRGRGARRPADGPSLKCAAHHHSLTSRCASPRKAMPSRALLTLLWCKDTQWLLRASVDALAASARSLSTDRSSH